MKPKSGGARVSPRSRSLAAVGSKTASAASRAVAMVKRPAARRTASGASKSPLGQPISCYDAKCSLRSLRKEANRVGFDAKAYVDSGYCVLRALWSKHEVARRGLEVHIDHIDLNMYHICDM